MHKKQSMKRNLKILFGLILGLFILAEICAILGIMGVGDKVVNIISHMIILATISFVVIKGYSTLVKGWVIPLLELEAAAKNISQGNLDVEVKFQGKDEMGQLAESFRTTIHNLKAVMGDLAYIIGQFAEGNFNVKSRDETVYVGEFDTLLKELRRMVGMVSESLRQIDQTAGQVMCGSSDMAKGSQELAEGATDQAAAVEELLATVTEVTNQVLENTRTTEQAHDNAKTISEQAIISKKKMTDLTVAMNSIQETSKKIEDIIADIEEIASQTNLLSLNASIEAARAGEAGRGFAVVAGQIGKLAADSAQSAVTTRKLISEAIDEIQKGNIITEETAAAQNRVIEAMDDLVLAVASIRRASDIQAVSVKEFENGVEAINSVVQSNSASAEETSAISEQLSGQAVMLNQMVRRFQLSE